MAHEKMLDQTVAKQVIAEDPDLARQVDAMLRSSFTEMVHAEAQADRYELRETSGEGRDSKGDLTGQTWEKTTYWDRENDCPMWEMGQDLASGGEVTKMWAKSSHTTKRADHWGRRARIWIPLQMSQGRGSNTTHTTLLAGSTPGRVCALT